MNLLKGEFITCKDGKTPSGWLAGHIRYTKAYFKITDKTVSRSGKAVSYRISAYDSSTGRALPGIWYDEGSSLINRDYRKLTSKEMVSFFFIRTNTLAAKKSKPTTSTEVNLFEAF